ncbi:unnamed protein product [Prunus armeniaca]|nr:hypothetical protein GBA52_020424 [Prunus armeniaca]
MTEEQVAGKMMANELAVKKDEAKEGVADKVDVNAMEQVAKANEMATVDEQVAEADEQVVGEIGA